MPSWTAEHIVYYHRVRRPFVVRCTPHAAAYGVLGSQDEQTMDAKIWEANASSETQDVLTTNERDVDSQKARLSVPVGSCTAV